GVGGLVTTDFIGPGSDDQAEQVVVLPGQKILVVGSSDQGDTWRDFALTRYNGDGSLDTGFGVAGRATTDFTTPGGPTSDDFPSSVAIQADGKIVVAGVSTRGGAFGNDFLVARYNTNGTLDSTFGLGGKVRTDLGSESEFASAVAVQADGKIVVAG